MKRQNKKYWLICLILAMLFVLDSCSDEEARMAADAYIASMNTFDVSDLKVGSSEDWMASDLAISSNLLLSDEEKQQAHIDLWERYCFVSIGGNEDNICFKGNSYGFLYNNDVILKSLIDQGLDRFGRRFINKEFDKLVKTSDTYKYAITKGWCAPEDFNNNYVAKAAAIYCFNLNNKVLLDAAKWITIKMPSEQNPDEISDLKKQFTNKFLAPSGSILSLKKEKSTKLYYFKYYSHKQFLELPTYYNIMNGLLCEMFEVAVSKHQ